MTTQKSETTVQLQCLQKGGPFKLVHVSKPIPANDQVLIRQSVIPLNGLDQKQHDCGIMVKQWPHVLGIEGAGVIESVGSDVANLKPGDEVIAWASGRAHNEPWGGSFQERIIVPACFVAKKPKNIALVDASSLPIAYNTAVIAIYHGLKVPLPYLPNTSTTGPTPKSVLILGGSSAVGANAISLLRLAYPDLPIFATSSTKHHDHLKELGATKLFDYHSSTIVLDIKAASPGSKGIDVIIDCVGAGMQQKDICDVFDPAQSKLYSSVFTGVDVPVPDGVTKHNVSGWSLFDVQGGKEALPAITKLLEDGSLKVPLPVKVVGHGLEALPEAMKKLAGVSGEKLVVTI